MIDRDEQSRELKSLSPQDFLLYGVGDLAYIKPVVQTNGQKAYAIHTADGTAVAEIAKYDIARAMAAQHDSMVLDVQ